MADEILKPTPDIVKAPATDPPTIDATTPATVVYPVNHPLPPPPVTDPTNNPTVEPVVPSPDPVNDATTWAVTPVDTKVVFGEKMAKFNSLLQEAIALFDDNTPLEAFIIRRINNFIDVIRAYIKLNS